MSMIELDSHPGYALCDDGFVYNLKLNRRLKGHVRKSGYLFVTLNEYPYLLHRLMAEHYVENPNGFRWVKHLDGNKLNNEPSNLKWVRDNSKDAPHDGEKVSCFNADGKLIKEYNDIHEAELDGYNPALIRRCLRGISKTHKKLIWK